MLTDALLDCYSLNSGSMLHASSPQREAALKELEASENGFRENLLLPWQDSPFQHSRVRIKLRGGLKHCEIVSPQADELSNRSYGFHFVVAFFFSFPQIKHDVRQQRFIFGSKQRVTFKHTLSVQCNAS